MKLTCGYNGWVGAEKSTHIRTRQKVFRVYKRSRQNVNLLGELCQVLHKHLFRIEIFLCCCCFFFLVEDSSACMVARNALSPTKLIHYGRNESNKTME